MSSNIAGGSGQVKKNAPLVTKSNALVEATYKLTLAEQRLLLAVIAKIDSRLGAQEISADTKFEIVALEVSETYPVEQNKAYDLLREATERLYDRSIIIHTSDPDAPGEETTKTRWVHAVTYKPKHGVVDLYFAPKVIPHLTNLAREFTSYHLTNVSGMTSIYAIRLYELLVQWRTTGEREVPIDWIKEQFLIPDDYTRIYDLKKRVIVPAVEQINTHSDISVKWTQRKQGRNVIAFVFTFGPKKPAATPAVTSKRPQKLTDAEVQKHARPGETWEQARDRLRAELSKYPDIGVHPPMTGKGIMPQASTNRDQ